MRLPNKFSTWGIVKEIKPTNFGAIELVIKGKNRKWDREIKGWNEYETCLSFTAFGDKKDLVNGLAINDFVALEFTVESKPTSDGARYFHNLNISDITIPNFKNDNAHRNRYEKDMETGQSDNMPF